MDIGQVVNLGIIYEEIGGIPLQYLIGVELNEGMLPRTSRNDVLMIHSSYGSPKPRAR